MNENRPSLRSRFRPLMGQFVKFGLVGVSNTVISIVVYNLLLFAGVHYIISYVAAFLISVGNAYLWNRKFVFARSGAGGKKTFFRVFLSYGSTCLLGIGLLYLLVRYAGVSKSLSQILILLVTIPANFLLNKLWAFQEKL